MVFGGQITFSTPPKMLSALNFFFGGFLVFSAPKTKNRLFRRAPTEVVFSGAQAEKHRVFFFRRRLVMMFGGQITFSTPPFFGGRLRSKGLELAI